MLDIMVYLVCLRQCLDRTTLGRLSRVIEAMLAMTGRVTMRGRARWAGTGGSYRTIQRFLTTSINWATLHWVLMRHPLLEPDEVIVLGGDEVVVTKAGTHTYGSDRFFGTFQNRVKVVDSLPVYTSGRAGYRHNWSPEQRDQ